LPEAVHRLLEAYYAAAYDKLASGTTIPSISTRYGRMQIGAEVFGSIMSSRHQTSAFIFAKFAGGRGGHVDVYPGQVQYYIKHALEVPGQESDFHYLAYVRWYRPAHNSFRRYYYSLHEENSGIELWLDDFYEISRLSHPAASNSWSVRSSKGYSGQFNILSCCSIKQAILFVIAANNIVQNFFAENKARYRLHFELKFAIKFRVPVASVNVSGCTNWALGCQKSSRSRLLFGKLLLLQVASDNVSG
jgi:hypothetical protein